jgi:hypothetical protein
MRRARLAALAAAVAVSAAAAQQEPAPEECMARANDPAAITVSHAGKSYRLASEACGAQFLTDPERYAQLYDALLELEREGTPLRAPSPSLVPS